MTDKNQRRFITTMTKPFVIFSALLLLAGSAVAQESKGFSFPDEREDSLNSLSIVPLKSARARRVVEKVIRRYQKDLKVTKEGHKYLVSATFRQDSLESFTAQ